MGRRYVVNFGDAGGFNTTVPLDLIQITGAAGKIVLVLKRWVSSTDTSIATTQMLQLRERFLPANVTPGNGSSVTPAKVDQGDAAASFTALVCSSSKATTSGTAVVLNEDGCHVFNGFREIVDEPWPIGPSEAYVFELLSTVTQPVHLCGGALLEEIGG